MPLKNAAKTATQILLTESNFPQFKDGDVIIIIGGARHYKLHAEVLKAASPVLKDLVAGPFTAVLSAKAIKSGVTVRSRLVLVANNGAEDTDLPLVLKPIKLSNEGKPSPGTPALLELEFDNARVPDPLSVAYDNVFRAMYGRPMDLGDSQRDGLDMILAKAVSIIDVAEYLKVEDIITTPIEATLLACGQKLYRAIATQPAAWLQFAFRVQSRPMFEEALIHATGKYNQQDIRNGMKQLLSPAVARVLKRKGESLKDMIVFAQRNVLSYYPAPMQRPNTGREGHGRQSYANDIFQWMAMSLFRQWVTDKVVLDHTHHAKDMGFGFFSLLNAPGEPYLRRGHFEDFLRHFPLSAKGLNVVEEHVDAIKKNIKYKHVAQLFQKTCQLDISTYPVKHFTCVKVIPEDYPWHDGSEEDGGMLFEMSDLDPTVPRAAKKARKALREGRQGVGSTDCDGEYVQEFEDSDAIELED